MEIVYYLYEHTLQIRCVSVDRGLSQSHINDVQSTHEKITIGVRIVENLASW